MRGGDGFLDLPAGSRRSGRAALSGGSPDFGLVRGLAGKPGPEHEDGDSEGGQCREQADRGAPGEPEDDETGQGCDGKF